MANYLAMRVGSTNDVDGLVGAVQSAPTKIMKAIGYEALRKNYTLGTLAQALNEQDETCLEATNVRRHFRSIKPREETVNAYARALRIDASALRVLSGAGQLAEPRVSEQLRFLRKALLLSNADFEANAIDEARSVIDTADERTRVRVATRYYCSMQNPLTSSVDAIIAALEGLFSLTTRRRIPNEDFLWGLWMEAVTGLDEPGAEAVIATAIGFLRMRGVDTAHVEERLRVQHAAHHRALNEVNGAAQL